MLSSDLRVPCRHRFLLLCFCDNLKKPKLLSPVRMAGGWFWRPAVQLGIAGP